MSFALAIVALLLLLGYDRRRLYPPAIRGREWAVALIGVIALLAAQRVFSSDARAAWERHSVATTSIEDGSGTAVVALTYGGKPLDGPDGASAYVTLREMKTNRDIRVSAPLAHGVVTLASLRTGVYAFSIVLDANRQNGLARNRPMAGDYEGHEGRIRLVGNGDVATTDVKVFRMLHLLRPEDTEMGLARIEECAHVSAPVEFEWEPVPLATGYRCFVTRRWRKGQSWSSDYTQSSYGSETACRFDLPPNAPGERYAISIEAEGDTGRLTHFEDPRRGWASEYCFVVQ